MSAISFPFLIALREVLKRLWLTCWKQTRGLRKGQSSPYQGGESRHRHNAFFELP